MSRYDRDSEGNGYLRPSGYSCWREVHGSTPLWKALTALLWAGAEPDELADWLASEYKNGNPLRLDMVRRAILYELETSTREDFEQWLEARLSVYETSAFLARS